MFFLFIYTYITLQHPDTEKNLCSKHNNIFSGWKSNPQLTDQKVELLTEVSLVKKRIDDNVNILRSAKPQQLTAYKFSVINYESFSKVRNTSF